MTKIGTICVKQFNKQLRELVINSPRFSPNDSFWKLIDEFRNSDHVTRRTIINDCNNMRCDQESSRELLRIIGPFQFGLMVGVDIICIMDGVAEIDVMPIILGGNVVSMYLYQQMYKLSNKYHSDCVNIDEAMQILKKIHLSELTRTEPSRT